MTRCRIRPYSLAWCIVGSVKLLMGIGLMYLNIILLKLEHLRMVAENDTNEQWLDAIAAATKAVADFTTNERR